MPHARQTAGHAGRRTAGRRGRASRMSRVARHVASEANAHLPSGVLWADTSLGQHFGIMTTQEAELNDREESECLDTRDSPHSRVERVPSCRGWPLRPFAVCNAPSRSSVQLGCRSGDDSSLPARARAGAMALILDLHRAVCPRRRRGGWLARVGLLVLRVVPALFG